MPKISTFILVRERMKWSLSFHCPACGKTNEQDPVHDTSTMKCKHCRRILDGTDGHVVLVDKTPDHNPHRL